jgi:lysophospholipase L1-like esterase
LKAIKVILFSSIIWVLILEGGARIIRNYFGDSLDQAKVILRPDNQTGWRQKSNLSTRFINTDAVTNPEGLRSSLDNFTGNSLKVLVLGPSSTYGWGVDSDRTYTSLLKVKLSKLIGKRVEVINAGQIGFSTEQAKELITTKWFKALKPDLVIIAYGVNDIDRHRFYFQSTSQDHLEFAEDNLENKMFLQKLLNHSAFLSLGLKYSFKILAKFSCPSRISLVAKTRVSFEHFEENIKFLSAYYQAPVLLVDTGHTYLLDAAKENNEGLYEKALSEATSGNCQKSRELVRQARESETYRINRDLRAINSILLKISAEMGYPIVKASSLLKGKGALQKYFVDPIHPNQLGHKMLSMAIIEKLGKIFSINEK